MMSTDDVKLAKKEEFQSGDVCKKFLGEDDGNGLLRDRSIPNGKELEMALIIMLQSHLDYVSEENKNQENIDSW